MPGKRKRWIAWPWWHTATDSICSASLPLTTGSAIRLLSYPEYIPGRASRITSSLHSHGVTGLCVMPGGRRPPLQPETPVVGLGRESIVSLASTAWGQPVVVKVRRTDSPRPSLSREASLQAAAYKAGVAPRVIAYTDDYILMEAIQGPLLDQLARPSPGVLAGILEAARALDAAGILHRELSRPWLHVLVARERRPLILDYGDASHGCGNLTRIIPPLARRGLVRMPPKELLARYKRRCDGETYEKILLASLGSMM